MISLFSVILKFEVSLEVEFVLKFEVEFDIKFVIEELLVIELFKDEERGVSPVEEDSLSFLNN